MKPQINAQEEHGLAGLTDFSYWLKSVNPANPCYNSFEAACTQIVYTGAFA
jgi:hypothetical protein